MTDTAQEIVPRVVVDPPGRTGLPYGLFALLTFRPMPDPHTYGGVTWSEVGCDPASGFGPAFCDPEDVTGLPIGFPDPADAGHCGTADADPFTVYYTWKGGLLGHPDGYAQQQATAGLVAREEQAAEKTLWTGALTGTGTGFASGADDVTPTPGTAASLKRALAVLEGWLGTDYGSLGVIHMTREAASLLLTAGALTASGTSLKTELGTPVIAGSGYPGTGPDGAAPGDGETWLYATPALFGYRSDVLAPTGTVYDTGHNDAYAEAERTYIIGWDDCPGTAAALASLE